MGYSSFFFTSFFLLLAVVTKEEPLVPALFIFGDSIVDVGNGNNLPSIAKANFLPYGRDFVTHTPTGRFSNGKLTIDFASEIVGFASYQPAYLNLKVKGKNLLNGANFASYGTGYHQSTATLYRTLSLNQQLIYYSDCQKELVKAVGQSSASSIIADAVYVVVAGTGDFAQNYYLNPFLNKVFTHDQFSNIIIQCYSNFIQKLYALGARKIAVSTLPPIGCLPFIITLFSPHSNKCVEMLNNVAIDYNIKLNSTSEKLLKMLPNLNLVILDIYEPLYKLITKPTDYGFFESRKACCATGLIEIAIFCNQKSIGTCANASEYVFWDGYHTSQAANKFLFDHVIPIFSSLINTNRTLL
ncbi:GDSL esterase/lipase At5g22810-like [Cicer arietinum]|uniref:GDSL esterase/lipase At5g22810-like n=1 Tax=Cicer arietinum TaxID=3827 RepID=A0A1S2XEZ9_CICAR|nr:GDSL esterase/lipase At5g22810-like [Cicer arietinum]